MRSLFLKLMIGMVSLSLAGGGAAAAGEQAIVVGGKNFTEQFLLAEMAKILLEEQGLPVNLRTGVGSIIARKSLENGQIDLYYEYTGTAYTVYYHQKDPAIMRDPQQVYQWVKEKDRRRDLVWLAPLKLNNTYTLLMRQEQAERLGIRSVGDLAALVREQPEKLRFAVNTEFWERPDGFKKMMGFYDFRVPLELIRKMSLGLTYKALQEEEVDVAMGFATDGRIPAFGFVSLEDNRGFFPRYNPAPVVRQEVLAAHPRLREILRPLAENLSTEEMRRLNAAVDIDHRNEHQVALEWLQAEGIL